MPTHPQRDQSPLPTEWCVPCDLAGEPKGFVVGRGEAEDHIRSEHPGFTLPRQRVRVTSGRQVTI